LIDASRKKISFLKHIIRDLKLSGIDARQIKTGELAREKTADNFFDVIICRAFSKLDKIILQALPLLAKDGIIIAMKGKLSGSEIKTAGKHKTSWSVIKYKLPFLELERSLIIIKE
ncbi:MAG: class I SAM-dependent methyltransferase, partial [Deltaproteobacteria bacterium]|nr:class I SAM-dependent methyltransferase [Deltaproteobacteria bacterium]